MGWSARGDDDASPPQWLLFGLGNPGIRYAETRHNLGWMLVDLLCERMGERLVAGRADYFRAIGRIGGAEIHVIKPTTFMNLSGRAVRQYLSIEKPVSPRVVIAVDDVAIPLGRLRMRPRGASGGHNGLESIEEHLRTTDFTRIRMGCGPVPEGVDMGDYVLEEFAPDERETVTALLERAADALESWVQVGAQTTMSKFNG